ncbi:MAG: class I SAM-dependent methyltransferase, partial [Planctomycetota bacterium JB042]
MSREDRRRWDLRHRTSGTAAPNRTLASLLPRLPRSGRALDVACGAGANAELLVRRGFRVAAVDVSGEALRRARRRVDGGALVPIQMDLDAPAVRDGATWDLVVCISFLDRALLDRLAGWVAPGGLLFGFPECLPASPVTFWLGRCLQAGGTAPVHQHISQLAGELTPERPALLDGLRYLLHSG